MRKIICTLGAITFIFVDFGLLFKIMHYPGGSLFLLIGMGAGIPILSILTAIYIGNKRDNDIN